MTSRARNEQLLEALIRANKAEAAYFFDNMQLLGNYVATHWLAYRMWLSASEEVREMK